MSQEVDYQQINDLEERIANIRFVLGTDPIKPKASPESTQKKPPIPNQSIQQLSTIEAFKLMEKKLYEKGVEQHHDFIQQVIAVQHTLDNQQAVQDLCLSMNEKANVILCQASKISQTTESLKQISQMARYLEFAPVIEQKQKVQTLIPLDEHFLRHAKDSQNNSDNLDTFLKSNNQIINDLNLRFLNIENKLSSLENK